jgi:hypothetical protein
MRRLAYIALGFGLALLVLEALLRLLPVSTDFPRLAVNDANPVMRGEPGYAFTYSKGWNFRLVNRGRLNNEGFVAPTDFRSNSGAVVLIGDSYIQAQAIPAPQTLASTLRSRWGGVDVYPVGLAGAGAADYLALTEWSVKRYAPSMVIIILVEGDVDESTQPRAGSYHFAPRDGGYELRRTDYAGLTPFKRAIVETRTAEYLLQNLLAVPNFHFGKRVRHDGVQAHPARRELIETFLRELRHRIGREKTVLVINGDHNFTGQTRRDVDELADVAEQQQWHVVRLNSVFEAWHVQHPAARLDFLPVDAHWNRVAQGLVADELVRQLPFGMEQRVHMAQDK